MKKFLVFVQGVALPYAVAADNARAAKVYVWEILGFDPDGVHPRAAAVRI